MHRLLAILLLSLIAGCAAQPETSIQPGGRVGILNLMPDKLVHHKYGTLAGISQSHYAHEPPVALGPLLAGQVQQALAGVGAQAVVLTTSDTLKVTTRTVQDFALGSKAPPVPELFENRKFQGRWRVAAPYRAELEQIAKAEGIGTFLLLRPYMDAPNEMREAWPGAYSYGVISKNTIVGERNFAFMLVMGEVIDPADMTIRTSITMKDNAIQLDDYANEGGKPLPKPELIEAHLKELMARYSARVAQRFAPAPAAAR